MARFYLITILVVGFMGSMLTNPSSMRSASSNGEDHFERNTRETRERIAEAEKKSREPMSDAIELERSYDGHFYADVEINGMAVRALVDTGASGIALSRDDARRAGLAPSIAMPEVVGEGAGGDVRGEFVMLDRVSLGQKNVEKVPAVILDGGDMTLLGQSFLSRFASVEIRDDKMLLR